MTDATDWREFFEERAAIREFDGRQSRADAERGARADIEREKQARAKRAERKRD